MVMAPLIKAPAPPSVFIIPKPKVKLPSLNKDYDLIYKEYQRTGGTLDIPKWVGAGTPLRPEMEYENIIPALEKLYPTEVKLTRERVPAKLEEINLRLQKEPDIVLKELLDLGGPGDAEIILKGIGATPRDIDSILGTQLREKQFNDVLFNTFPEYKIDEFIKYVDQKPDEFIVDLQKGGWTQPKEDLLHLMDVPQETIRELLPMKLSEKEAKTAYDKMLADIYIKYPKAPYTKEQMASDWYQTMWEEKQQAWEKYQSGLPGFGESLFGKIIQPSPTPSGYIPGQMPSATWLDKVKEIQSDPRKLIPFVSSGVEITTIGNLLKTAKDLEAGKEVSKEDLLALSEYVERSQRDTSWGYKVADILANLVPFAGEFIATGGIYSVGKTATVKAATEALKRIATKQGAKLLEKALVKYGVEVAGTLAGGTLRTIPTGVTRIPAKTLEKQLVGTLTGDEEPVWKSLIKATGEQWVEVVSESTGGLFAPLTSRIKGQLAKMALFKAFLETNPSKSVNDATKVFRALGYNGVIEEMLEERVADVGHGILESLGLGDQKFTIPSLQQLAVELVAFSIPGVALKAVGGIAPAMEELRLRPERGGIEVPEKPEELAKKLIEKGVEQIAGSRIIHAKGAQDAAAKALDLRLRQGYEGAGRYSDVEKAMADAESMGKAGTDVILIESRGAYDLLIKGKVAPVTPEVTKPEMFGAPPTEVSAKATLPNQVRQIHLELQADINLTRKKIAEIKTPLATQGADVQFARLALNDADRLVSRIKTLNDRIEQGLEVSVEEVASIQDKLASLKDYYKYETKTQEQIKQKLTDYINDNLPLRERGKLVALVKNAQTEGDLTSAIARVDEMAEVSTEQTLRADITSELKTTVPKVEKGITTGRLSPEVQPEIEKLRASLLVGLKGKAGVAANTEAYETAREQIALNIKAYQEGKMTWEALIAANENLKYTGIHGMSSAQLQEALDYIQELKRVGKDIRKLRRESIQLERQQVVDKSLTEITGGKGIKVGRGTLQPEDLAADKQILDQPVNSQYGFDNLLDKLGKFAKGTKQYQGYLMRFSKAVQKSTNVENTGRETSFKIVREEFREIYNVSKTRDATRMLETLCNEKVDLGTFKITTDKGVQYLPIHLTKAQMMETYQLYKNPKNLETFKDGMHWTPEVMTKIVNTLNPQDIAFADWLQNEFYPAYYEKINPFYGTEFNIDMPKNPEYVPQSRDFDAGETDEVQLLLNDQKRYASVTNKSLKARQENIRPFKLNGVFTVLTNHIVQMEHFMAWAETMHELRSTFGNNEVRTAIRQYHSNDILKRIDDYMNDFARGGVDRAQFLHGLDKARSRFAVSVLALKPSIGLQQIGTVGAFMTEMPIRDFITGATDFWKNPIENYKWMMEHSAYIKARYTGGNYERDIRISQQTGIAKTLSGATNMSQYLLWQVTQGDKFGVMPGWWAKYKSGLKDLSEPDAMIEADLASERTQNTSEIASLSWLQRGSSFGKLLTMFQSQPNKYFRIVADNIRNMQYGRQSKVKGLTNLLIIWVVLPVLFQFIADGLKFKKEHQGRILLLGPLNNILVAGQLVQNAWGWFTGDNFDWQASPVLSTVRDLQNFSMKLVKIIRQAKNPYEDVSMDDVVSAIEFFTKAGGQLTGLPTPYLIQLEKAARNKDLRQVVFSKWALEEPKPDLASKSSSAKDKIGVMKELDPTAPEDKLPEISNMADYWSEQRTNFAKTLPSDITQKNGFDEIAVAFGQALLTYDTYESLPDKKLYEIVDNIQSDETLNYQIAQYWFDWQNRKQIKSLAELKEYDKTHPRAYWGNVSKNQLETMWQYSHITDEQQRVRYREQREDLNINPREAWLKANPTENAQLAIFGQADVLTQKAYDTARSMVKTLDILDAAVADFLPPDNVAKPYFEYKDAISQWSANSREAQLIKAKNPDLTKWLKLDMPDTPVKALELQVKNATVQRLFDSYSNKDSPNYLDDKVKDAKGLTARDRGVAKLRLDNSVWVDDQHRIDVFKTPDGTDEIAEMYVYYGRVVDATSANSKQAKAFRLKNPALEAWGEANLDWEPITGTGENSPYEILRSMGLL